MAGTGTRLAVYAAALAVFAGLAAGVGYAVGPPDGSAEQGHREQTEAAGTPEGEHGSEAAASSGLAVASAGYRLVVERAPARAGVPGNLRFRVVDGQGETVRDFDEEGGVRMHLIVARGDLTGYQHLHPAQRGDGSWASGLTLSAAGVYRVFVDFDRQGERVVLAWTLLAGGDFEPVPLPAPRRKAAVDGYEIGLSGEPRAGAEGELVFRVERRGEPVALEPYLGARGHLVALREGDLAYLHVHPVESDARRGEVRFAATFPTPGRYRLFLQFSHGGQVHTTAFTQELLQ